MRRGARISWLSLKIKVDDLSVIWPQNHWDGFLRFGLELVATVFSDLASKSVATVSFGLGLKSVVTVSFGLVLKPVVTVFPDLASKPVVIFLVEPLNQSGAGFSGLALNISSYGLVI
jgi:hypothetical protein